MIDLQDTIKRINDKLVDDGITNHIHRLMWLACAMVALRFGSNRLMDDPTNSAILGVLRDTNTSSDLTNSQLRELQKHFEDIRYNNDEPKDVSQLLQMAREVRAFLNSDDWSGEDVFQIMYEIIAVKQKSARGQVFTPAHIGQLMAGVLDVHEGDHVLDAACGTGSLLLKCCKLGVLSTDLYGVEWDYQMYALCVANILAHDDGIANILHGDSTTEEVADWIKSKDITKTIMNPPYENKFGCPDIVGNVLDSVPDFTKVAMLLPDKKLEKFTKRKQKRITDRAVLDAVIKLPNGLFQPLANVAVSLFIWETGTPQGDTSYMTAFLEDDGFTTYKNSPRIDPGNKWPAVMAKWLPIIRDSKYDGLDGATLRTMAEGLSYQEPEKPFEIYEEDFRKTAFDYLWFEMNEKRRKDGLPTVGLVPTLMKAIYSGRLVINNAVE